MIETGMRTKGSCRFAPYFKVQWYDGVSMCWREIQKAHPTEAYARGEILMLPDKICRVQKVTESGRTII